MVKQTVIPFYKGKKKNGRLRPLALSLCLLTFAGVSAQTDKVSLDVKNATVKELFSAIEKQTPWHFSYRDAEVKEKERVTLSVKNEELKVVLTQELKKRNLTYRLSGNKIIIISADADKGSSKKVTVKGQIKDEKGEPIIGVTIMLASDQSVGTITDHKGDFSLSGVPENDYLLVSYIGYKDQSVPIRKNTFLNIMLQEDSQALDEVVVVGYGVQKKANLSGAVSVVETKTIENRPVLNMGQALQGAVANFNVSIGDGEADDSPKYNIRGYTSINGGEPLVVIDGVVSTSDQLNRMNPTDIAGISVLKDAASSAIYGSRAAYGVILVTTRMGSSEKLTVNYNNNFVLRTNTHMPEIITDPYTVATISNEMAYPWYNLFNEEQLAYAKKVSEDPSLSPYYVNPDGTWSYFGRTNWMEEAYKDVGFSTIHNIDISGKTERIAYYFSGGYNRQNGMFKMGNDIYNRYNVRSKLQFKLTDWWKLDANLSMTASDYDYATAMTNTYREMYRKSTIYTLKNPDGTWTDSSVGNLGAMAEGGRATDWKNNMNINLSTRIDFIKDVLFVQGNFAYANTKTRSNWHDKLVPYRNGPDLPLLMFNPLSSVSDASSSSSDTKHLVFDVYGTFQKTFAQVHSLTAVLGFNQEEYKYDYFKANRAELISESLPTINLATGDMNMSQKIESWALRGAFARLGYVYADKYIFEFNGRYDGTSRFPKKDRFVFNPSASLGWVISREDFFKPLKNIISFLKLRGSYGRLGNQDVSTYAYVATMGSGKISQILEGKQPIYVSAPGLVSGNLTWEKVTTANIGMDINFFDNRLTMTGEFYIRRTKDMLTKGYTLPAVLGTSVPKQNAANLKTRGWEVTVGWKDQLNLCNKPFIYNANFNLADSRAWITKYDNPTGYLGDHYVGQELGEIWGVETLGFFTSEEDIKNHAD